VEEQQKGVFPKTLKYMWDGGLVFINPLPPFRLALFACLYFKVKCISKQRFLIEMASQVGGNWLAI